MRHTLFIICILMLCLSGCREFWQREEPPRPEEPVGPQTKAEVLAEIRPVISPLRHSLSPGAPVISDMHRDQIMAQLRNAIISYGDTDFGKEALNELAYEVMDIARRASADDRHQLVLVCIDVVELLAVESHLLKRLGARADVMLEKPVVRVKGFLEDIEKNQLYVFLDLINHRTGAVERVEAREGDEFHNLRLWRIQGRNRSVIFEYLKVPGLFFEVKAF